MQKIEEKLPYGPNSWITDETLLGQVSTKNGDGEVIGLLDDQQNMHGVVVMLPIGCDTDPNTFNPSLILKNFSKKK